MPSVLTRHHLLRGLYQKVATRRAQRFGVSVNTLQHATWHTDMDVFGRIQKAGNIDFHQRPNAPSKIRLLLIMRHGFRQ